MAVVGNPNPASRTLAVAEFVARRVGELAGVDDAPRVIDVVDYGPNLLQWGDPTVAELKAEVLGAACARDRVAHVQGGLHRLAQALPRPVRRRRAPRHPDGRGHDRRQPRPRARGRRPSRARPHRDRRQLPGAVGCTCGDPSSTRPRSRSTVGSSAPAPRFGSLWPRARKRSKIRSVRSGLNAPGSNAQEREQADGDEHGGGTRPRRAPAHERHRRRGDRHRPAPAARRRDRRPTLRRVGAMEGALLP